MGSSWSAQSLFLNDAKGRLRKLNKAQHLYQMGDIEKAIAIWTKLTTERRVSDDLKLTAFGWLAIACFTTGHYREMATWSARQLRMARQICREPSSTVLVEALLNVARSELGQGNLARAGFFAAEALAAAGERVDLSIAANLSSSYHDLASSVPPMASSSLNNNNGSSSNASNPTGVVTDCRRLSGYCHLVVAETCFGEGNISTGLEHLDRALLVARQCADQLLELFVQMALAQLFMALKDYNRALHYCGRSESMARTLQPSNSPDVMACQRSISLSYATVMRKLGRPDYAETVVQELLGDSSCTRDPSFQANCFILLGDLSRSEGQFLRAYSLYENAYSLMRQSGSRFGELTVLLQLAKCLLRMREGGTVCECKAVEVLQRCCLFARSSNANMIRIRSLRFLEKVLLLLGDEKAVSATADELARLRSSIGLVCAVCRRPLGEKQSAVSILPCAHLAHDNCLLMVQRNNDGDDEGDGEDVAKTAAPVIGSISCSNTLSRSSGNTKPSSSADGQTKQQEKSGGGSNIIKKKPFIPPSSSSATECGGQSSTSRCQRQAEPNAAPPSFKSPNSDKKRLDDSTAGFYYHTTRQQQQQMANYYDKQQTPPTGVAVDDDIVYMNAQVAFPFSSSNGPFSMTINQKPTSSSSSQHNLGSSSNSNNTANRRQVASAKNIHHGVLV